MHPLTASFAIVFSGVIVLWQATDGLTALTTERARRLVALNDMPPVPSFAVETMAGTREPLPPKDGRAAVIEFIYTSCPTVCQVAGTEMARLRDRLATGPLSRRVRLVSLSFDPAHDTRERLAAYGGWHRADGFLWTVARPGADDVSALLGAYGVTVISDRIGGFIHNAALHVVSPDGRLVAILDMDDLDGAEEALKKALR